jgi:hypothetical protein
MSRQELCCTATSWAGTLVSPFSRVLSLGWYDGTTRGLAQCRNCGTTFKYDIVDWDKDQERRIFALSPFDAQEFDRMVQLFATAEEPRWPFWNPKRQLESHAETKMQEHPSTASSPKHLIVSDRELKNVFGARRITQPIPELLNTTFDGLPITDAFVYWMEYIGLAGAQDVKR